MPKKRTIKTGCVFSDNDQSKIAYLFRNASTPGCLDETRAVHCDAGRRGRRSGRVDIVRKQRYHRSEFPLMPLPDEIKPWISFDAL
jgi:hypothetical protein